MPPVGFEPTISAGEWRQTYALDRVATGTGSKGVNSSITAIANIDQSTKNPSIWTDEKITGWTREEYPDRPRKTNLLIEFMSGITVSTQVTV